MMRVAKAFGLVLILFLAVYLPAFAMVGGLKLSLPFAVPLIIVITLTLAVTYIAFLSRREGGFQAYGFRSAEWRYVLWAIVLALILGVPLTWGAQRLATGNPFGGAHFRLWMLALYFPVAAAFQEEVIFRGLLQTFLSRRMSKALRLPRDILAVPVVAIALLFGVIHAGFGAFTMFSAVVLGLLAGELRQRSGSLLPPIIVHAIFNGASLFWMLA